MTDFFKGIEPVKFEGPQSSQPARLPPLQQGRDGPRQADGGPYPPGRRLLAHLRLGGRRPVRRPHLRPPLVRRAAMEGAKLKADVAFELFDLLDVPFFCFHDATSRPRARRSPRATGTSAPSPTSSPRRWRRAAPSCSGARPTCSPTAATWRAPPPTPTRMSSPMPPAQVKNVLEITHELGGANYVLWGGREGYETLLNTRIRQEQDQVARFLDLVIEHAKKIGFKGQILIEPKPQEPTKHQYDYDVATVYGFLKNYGLEKDVKVNIEVGHAFLAGHSLRARAGGRRVARHPRLGRRQPQRPAVGLGHRPVPQQPGRDDAGLLPDPQGRRPRQGRLQLRRQGAPPVARSGRPAARPCRRPRHPGPRPQGRRGADRGRHLRQGARGPLRRLAGEGRRRPCSRASARSSRSPSGWKRRTSTRSRAPASRNISRTWSTGSSRRHGQSASLSPCGERVRSVSDRSRGGGASPRSPRPHPSCPRPSARFGHLSRKGRGARRSRLQREHRHAHHPQSHPARLQSGPLDPARRRRLLHRHLDLRVVPGRADPSLARTSPTGSWSPGR